MVSNDLIDVDEDDSEEGRMNECRAAALIVSYTVTSCPADHGSTYPSE